MKTTFPIPCGKNTTHWVNVVLHRTTEGLRKALKKAGHKDPSNTLGACWQPGKPAVDHCIAEIHLAHDNLDLDTVAHEATHAAFHRANLIGLVPASDKYEEWVATDAGILTTAIMDKLKTL